MLNKTSVETLKKLHKEIWDILKYDKKLDEFDRDHLLQIKEYLERILGE